jgi:hypothetical protein
VVRLLSRAPALVPLLTLLLIVWSCYRLARRGNEQNARWIAVIVLLLGLSDGALLWALPRLGLSFGPVGWPSQRILGRCGWECCCCAPGRSVAESFLDVTLPRGSRPGLWLWCGCSTWQFSPARFTACILSRSTRVSRAWASRCQTCPSPPARTSSSLLIGTSSVSPGASARC